MSIQWRYAAVHLGDAGVAAMVAEPWSGDGRPVTVPCEIAMLGENLVFGSAAGELADRELSPLATVDDPHSMIGTSLVAREVVLRGVIGSALGDAGAHELLDVLEIAVPSAWGESRRRTIRSATSDLAREVVVVGTGAAAVATAGERAPASAVVVEVHEMDTTVSVVDGGSDAAHIGYESAVVTVPHGWRFWNEEAWRGSIGSALATLTRHCPADVFVVDAPESLRAEPVPDRTARRLTGSDIALSLSRRAGAAPPMIDPSPPEQVSPNRISQNQVSPDAWPPELSSGQPAISRSAPRSAAWLNSVESQPRAPGASAPRRAAVIVVAAAAAAAAVAAVLYLSMPAPSTDARTDAAPMGSPQTTQDHGEPTAIAEPGVLEPDGSPSEAGIPSETAAPSTSTFALGRVSVRMPSSWTLLEASTPRPDRMILVPNDLPGRRIVVTALALVPGSDLPGVAADLRASITSRGNDSPVGSFVDATDFGGRTGIAYVESPGDGSTVVWRVFVESDLQISIGCQFEGDAQTLAEGDCARATDGLEVIPNR